MSIQEAERYAKAWLDNLGVETRIDESEPVVFPADHRFGNVRMVVCPTCGNKRCPRAGGPDWLCSGSNEPDQRGLRLVASWVDLFGSNPDTAGGLSSDEYLRLSRATP
jgi:hypothetical protein